MIVSVNQPSLPAHSAPQRRPGCRENVFNVCYLSDLCAEVTEPPNYPHLDTAPFWQLKKLWREWNCWDFYSGCSCLHSQGARGDHRCSEKGRGASEKRQMRKEPSQECFGPFLTKEADTKLADEKEGLGSTMVLQVPQELDNSVKPIAVPQCL